MKKVFIVATLLFLLAPIKADACTLCEENPFMFGHGKNINTYINEYENMPTFDELITVVYDGYRLGHLEFMYRGGDVISIKGEHLDAQDEYRENFETEPYYIEVFQFKEQYLTDDFCYINEDGLFIVHYNNDKVETIFKLDGIYAVIDEVDPDYNNFTMQEVEPLFNRYSEHFYHRFHEKDIRDAVMNHVKNK